MLVFYSVGETFSYARPHFLINCFKKFIVYGSGRNLGTLSQYCVEVYYACCCCVVVIVFNLMIIQLYFVVKSLHQKQTCKIL